MRAMRRARLALAAVAALAATGSWRQVSFLACDVSDALEWLNDRAVAVADWASRKAVAAADRARIILGRRA